METETKKMKFLSDQPVVEDRLGTHKHIAQLLQRIMLSDSDNPVVVGLFGSWGSGKSSIAKMYNLLIQDTHAKNVYIDCWAYTNAKEKFGASFLKRLANDLIEQRIARESTIRNIDQRYERWNTIFDLGQQTWYLFLSTLVIFLGAVLIGIWLIGAVDKPEFDLFIFMLTTVIVNGVLNWVLPKVMVTYESKTIDESYNKSEHFQTCFRTILRQTSYSTLSVVVDNLDRVEPADALEIIRILKTFVSEEVLEGKRLVFIVPCDEFELASHIKKNLYIENANEFLRKFFNITISVPELVYENLAAFTRHEISDLCEKLTEKIKDEDIELVSFVISRAVRKSPRQVKVLINSFISYWESAALTGTANNGISPLGAAIFVCLSYLRKGEFLPEKFSNVFEKNTNAGDLDKFLQSIKEFQRKITEQEWLYLQRLQISDDEKIIPSFNDIYYAITDNRWADIQTSMPNKCDIDDLISRLDIRTREDSSIARERFIKWVLSLIATKSIYTVSLSTPLRSYITHAVLSQQEDWKKFADNGLAEFIVQEEISRDRLILLLTEIKPLAEKNNLSNSQIKFVTRLINLSETKYWVTSKKQDTLNLVLDEVIFHCLPAKHEPLIDAIFKNVNVIVSENTGIRLAEVIASNFEPKSAIKLTASVDLKKTKGNDGFYAFAAQWLKKINPRDPNLDFEKQRLTQECIETLASAEDLSVVKRHIPDEHQFQELAGGIESYYTRYVNQGLNAQTVLSAITIFVLIDLTEKLKYQNIRSFIQDIIRTQVWPSLVNKFGTLPKEEQEKISLCLDKYPKLFGYIQISHLATLSQYELLGVFIKIKNEVNLLQSLVAELINRDYFGKVIHTWIKETINSLDANRDGSQEIQLLFTALQQKMPQASKYQDILESLLLAKKKIKTTKTLLKNHCLWLIGQMHPNDKRSIDITIEKLMILEKIHIDDEVITKLKEKISMNDLDVLKIVLSDKTKSWLNKHLGN